jgi:outer membrane protein assembly factor BamB
MRFRTVSLALLGATLAAGAAAPPPPAPLAPPVTTAPGGDYQTAWLTLAGGWEGGKDLPLFLGLRGGQAVQAWYCAPGRSDAHRLWLDEIAVNLAGGSLKGEVRGRMVKVWAPIAHVGNYVYVLDAKVESGRVTGTFTARFAPTAGAGAGEKEQSTSGAVSGRLASAADLHKDQAIPTGKDWPWYYGDGSAFCGPACGAAMIEDLKDVRPLWKAEEPLPTMWGKGPDGRYKIRACVVGVDGGASSPVVAGGRVYAFYFRPCGSVENEAALRREAAKFTASPAAQQSYVDWHRPAADDIVVCFDGATGGTLWKTVLPGRSVNHQTHKWRGYNPVPFIAGGMTYVVNYSNRLYALDAATGKVKWEYGRAAAKQFTASATGPAVAGGVVVACLGGGTVGLDARTGEELWKGAGGNLLVWRKGGTERIILAGANPGKPGMYLACLEPRTGKELWKAETDLWGARDVYPIVQGDWLVGCVAVKGDKPGEADFGRDSRVVGYRLADDGAALAWSAPAPYPAVDKFALTVWGGHVYVAGSAETFCLRLETGEKVASAPAGGARTQALFAADGRLFLQPEGRHGGQSFVMMAGDPANFRVLGSGTAERTNHPGAGQWVPPHPHDTAYANHPVMYPVVDGRLFVRGGDGLYCVKRRRVAIGDPQAARLAALPCAAKPRP